MKLRLLLWFIALRYRRALRRSPALRDYLKGIDRTVQFTTAAGEVARYLTFRQQALVTGARELDNADLTVRFNDASVGFAVLWAVATGKDRNAVMWAIQERRLTVEGDPMLLMWFQKSVKYLR